MSQPLKQKIIDELSKGDLCASNIKDACQTSYRELWEAIAQLKSEGIIECYFADTEPIATLTFRLKEKLPMSRLLPKPIRLQLADFFKPKKGWNRNDSNP